MVQRINLNITDRDKAALHKWAAMTGESMSSLVRYFWRQGLHRIGQVSLQEGQVRKSESASADQKTILQFVKEIHK